MNGRAGVGDETSANSELISLSKPAAELCIRLGNMLCQDVTDATRPTLSIGLQAFEFLRTSGFWEGKEPGALGDLIRSEQVKYPWSSSQPMATPTCGITGWKPAAISVISHVHSVFRSGRLVYGDSAAFLI